MGYKEEKPIVSMHKELPNMPAAADRFRFRDQLRLWEPPRAVVQQLAMLSSARQRLISVYNQLVGPLTEQQSFVNPVMQKQLAKSCKTSLSAIEKDGTGHPA